MDKSEVIIRLVAWARWKMLSGNALGFPKSSSFTHLVVDGSRRNVDAVEVDAWCIETNEAVDVLPAFHLLVIRVEYLSNVRDMQTKLELIGVKNRKTYYEYLNRSYKRIGELIKEKHLTQIN